MRISFLSALVVAVLLVAAAFGLAGVNRDTAAAAQESALRTEAAEERSKLDAYFERARAISRLMAHDSSFGDFYDAPGSRHAKVAAGGSAVRSASSALAYLERLYPDSIGEACFIDIGGAENARAVKGVVAPASELSPDERGNAFFWPAFARRPGQTYQSLPYKSPDTGEWVISNVAPIWSSGGARAIVHFEVTIESFRRTAEGEEGEHAVNVIDGRTGAVLIDARRPQRSGRPLGRPQDQRYRMLRTRTAAKALFSTPGRRAAYERVTRAAGNANDWLVVASAPALPSSSIEYFGAGSATMLAAALALLLGAGWSRRTSALRHEAHTDELTGLMNRRRLLRTLERSTASASGDAPCALLILDVDRFKELNDTLGHHIGDHLLTQLGPRLRTSVHPDDTLARLGGDEFAIVIRGGRPDAEACAERVRAALVEPFVLGGLTIRIAASTGIALCPEHATDAATLLQRADVAMYQAKAARTPWELYSPATDEYSRAQLALAGRLPQALEGDELLLHYQPQVELSTGRVTGVEGLVRWQHPELGVLAPDTFLAIAERAGLMPALTRYVIDAAMRQCAAWERTGRSLVFSVNVTAADLVDAGFAATVMAIVDAHGVSPERLRLEITEQTLSRDSDRVVDTLARLSEQGVSFALDDFGTGYSSLARLKQLPVQELKIDRSFVLAMAEGSDDATIVHSTIELAHNLRLRVVAEGIEDAATLARLNDMGCESGQGYFISRPLAPEALESWFVARDAAYRRSPTPS